MSTALRVEGVSKQYRIYDRPSDRLLESLSRGRLKRHREFWALRDVSFEVERGTTVGIIGPNGCGKSTLLQIIAGTLDPTHGQVWREGRVAALLELGAGFNPEFTGLENVFMSAGLMGFSRHETEALLPSIERFAEIGDFIHQPVKTYSSGMYVRLAFAVAVSVDPELLLVDEALAVGDAIFQHRCMRRIREMQERGTTILFVSHDPAAIRHLCSRAILLNNGHLIADGKTVDVLNRYQRIIMAREENYESQYSHVETPQQQQSQIETKPLQYSYRHGDGSARVLSVDLLDAAHRPIEVVDSGETLHLLSRVLFLRDVDTPVFGFMIRNRHGINVFGNNTEQQEMLFGRLRYGEVVEVKFSFNCWLVPEVYSITVAVHSIDGISYDWLDGALFFRVTSPIRMEGIANLNASIAVRKVHDSVPQTMHTVMS